jgi:hypothetical protein
VSSWFGTVGFERRQFPLRGGRFRVFRAVSSRGRVKGRSWLLRSAVPSDRIHRVTPVQEVHEILVPSNSRACEAWCRTPGFLEPRGACLPLCH